MVLMVVFSVITGTSPSALAAPVQPYSRMPGRTMSRYVSGYAATAPELAQCRMAKRLPSRCSTASMTRRNRSNWASV